MAITVKHLGVQPDDKVLEVGFGPGVGLEVALRKVEDGSGKVYGLEISQQMVTQFNPFYCTVEPRLSGLGGTWVNSPDNRESG